MDKIVTVVETGERLRNLILGNLHHTPARGERITLVAAYLDTVIEHHEAIKVLIRAGLYGPAFALARTVYDSSLRAFWVAACATDEEVRELRTTDNHSQVIPHGVALFSKLDSAYKLNNQLQNLKPKWDALCSYTHSGLRQLGRRGFRGAKQHGYSARAIIEILDFTTSSLASLARVYFAAAGNGIWALVVTAGENDYYASLNPR